MPKGKLLNGLVTQQKVLRGAVALFLEKGYTRTTTGEIAKAAGIGQSSFFHVFPSKEALLLELVKRMFGGQFDLAGQCGGAEDPVFFYAAETALQLHITELTEPLRELYVMAYSLPATSAYLYRSTAARLQKIFGPYLPEAEPKDFYEMEIASAGIMRGFMSVPCDLYFTMDAKVTRFLDCALKLYDVPAEKRKAVTAAVMLLSTVHAAAFSDTAGHWAEETLTAWQEQGRIAGYNDGSFHPDASVTRAGFVKMLNHALGFTAESDISFSDMKETDWFYTEVARAAATGYAQGSGGAFRPNQAVTRAEAAVMIARAAGLAASVERADAFADAASIPAWAKSDIGAAAKAGFMNGYSDGAFHADNLITRAQAVVTLDRVLRSAQDTVIEKSSTVLENETVTGDLIIAASVGEGAVTLKNVTVLGNLIVRGGASSIDLDGVRVSGAVQLQKENVRLHLSGNTALDRVEIAQPCRITRDGGCQGTLGTLVIDLAKTGGDVRIEVPAERVEILSRANVALNTDVEQLILGEDAERTQLEIQRGATVGRLTADARAKLTGSGRVSTLEVSVSGVTVGSGLTVQKTETENGAKAPSAASGGSSGGRSLKVITGAAPVAVQVDYGTEADAALAALPATVTLNLRDGSTVDAVATAWKWTEPVSNILTGTTAAYTAEGTFTVPSGCTYSGTAVVRATVTVRPLKTGAFTAALAAARAKQAGFTEEIDAAGATDPDTIYVLPDGTAEAAVTKDVQFIWAGNAAYTALKAAVTRAEPYANPEKFGSQTACDNLTAELTAAVDGIGNLTVMTGKNYTAAYVRAQIKK